MRESAVHATWPRSVSRHSWSFSPINSVVPRSRSPLPQAVRDAERRTGEPGVALLAGVRGENSPHYTKRPPERKNSIKKRTTTSSQESMTNTEDSHLQTLRDIGFIDNKRSRCVSRGTSRDKERMCCARLNIVEVILPPARETLSRLPFDHLNFSE